MRYRTYCDIGIIFFISIAGFTYGVFDRDLIAFETRFGVFVQEMLRYGPSFFPTTYNVPYPDYPGLHTFLIYLLCLPFGKLNTWCAILPSAVASASTLVLLYLILYPYDRRWAYACLLMTGLTYQFLDAARSLTMDSLIMAVTLWAFYSARKLPAPRHWGLWCACVLGFAIRGPIGFILPASIAGMTLWEQRGWRCAIRFAIKAMGVLSGLMMVLLSLAYQTGGPAFVAQVLQMQIFGRLHDHQQTHHFFDYFIQSSVNYAPSFELALLTSLFFWRYLGQKMQATAPLLRQCIFWVTIILLGMSVPNVRKIRYIMPMIPPLSILASYWWYQDGRGERVKNRITGTANLFFLFLPAVILCLLVLMPVLSSQYPALLSAHYPQAYIFLSACLLLSLLFCQKKNTLLPLAIGCATVWSVFVWIITPIQVSLNRAQPFVAQVLQQLPAKTQLVFFQMRADGVAIQFLYAANLVTAMTPPTVLNSIDGHHNQRVWFITSKKIFERQSSVWKRRVQIVLQKKLGHQPMVVFSLTPDSRDI